MAPRNIARNQVAVCVRSGHEWPRGQRAKQRSLGPAVDAKCTVIAWGALVPPWRFACLKQVPCCRVACASCVLVLGRKSYMLYYLNRVNGRSENEELSFRLVHTPPTAWACRATRHRFRVLLFDGCWAFASLSGRFQNTNRTYGMNSSTQVYYTCEENPGKPRKLLPGNYYVSYHNNASIIGLKFGLDLAPSTKHQFYQVPGIS